MAGEDIIRYNDLSNSSVLSHYLGHVAALARSGMNGSIPFDRTLEKTTGTIKQCSLALKQYTDAKSCDK